MCCGHAGRGAIRWRGLVDMDRIGTHSSARGVIGFRVVLLDDREESVGNIMRAALGGIRDAHAAEVKVFAHETLVPCTDDTLVASVAECTVYGGRRVSHGGVSPLVSCEVVRLGYGIELVVEAMVFAQGRVG